MSDQTKDERAPSEAEAAEANAERTEGSIDGDYEALVRLLKENEELKDRALRVAAEMENLRRRTARDVHDARTYAVANFARDMLSVSDNLRRALDAIPAEAKASGDAGFKALIEGVDLTERAMLSALERHGVRNSLRKARSSIPISTRPCSKYPIPMSRPTPWSRSCSRAIRLVSACCVRPWSASPRAARKSPPRRRSSRGR